MRLVIGIAVGAALIWLIRYLSNVLLPFFVACAVAYLLQPLVGFNMRLIRGRSRAVASILTIMDVSVVLCVVIYLFQPAVLRDLGMLDDIVKSVSDGRLHLTAPYAGIVDFINHFFKPENLRAAFDGTHIEELINKGSSLLEESIDVLVNILSWLLTIIYILFILIDYPQICRGFKLIIPGKYRPRAMTVIRNVADKMNRYFRGQGLVASCAMIFYCTGFSIVDLPLAIPMGVIVGILYMIPYFQYVTVIPVAAICFIYSLGGGVEFLTELGKCGLVYLISQCICDYIITPHIMKKEMGMNPAVILLSLSVWGSLLGIIGMIIALPVTAIIMAYYERYISNPTPKPATGDDNGG